MSDRAHQPSHDVDEENDTEEQTEQDDAPTQRTRYTSRGAIPRPLGGFQSPGPTASERAFGSSGATKKTARGGVPKRASPATERVENLIVILHRHSQIVSARLDDGTAGDMDPRELMAMTASLKEERASLLSALTNLPTGSPLMMKAFEATDRVSVVISRLDQLATSHEKKRERASELATGDKTGISQAAAEKVPDGYCDTAPQQVPPCHLQGGRREKYRAHLRKVTGIAARNWTAAIQKAQIAEKFRRNEVTFEQQLGQLILGLLFDVVGLAAKAGANRGIDKLDKVLGTTHRIEGEEIVKGGLDAATKSAAKTAADIVPGRVGAMQPIVQNAISAQQLAANAANATHVPADRESFLASIQDAPTGWELSVHGGIDHLLDADLEALVVAIPEDAARLEPTYFENRIADLVARFQRQVMAVDLAPGNDCRPVRVITQHGNVRLALTRAEKAPSKESRGEWSGVLVKTGKFTFVQWLDEDMKDMAVARAIQQDITAGAVIKTASDASFWNADSLKRLAQP